MRPRWSGKQRAAALLVVALALGGAFSAGMRWAGDEGARDATASWSCREMVEEKERLERAVAAAQGQLQIERAAQQKLSEENARLTAELARVKEELSVFSRLTGNPPSPPRRPMTNAPSKARVPPAKDPATP
ncbi:MAG: hypothetical protein N2441_04955 [Rhodocyclaceae bacterium]|nr:hypothetical protein [Rhodocyclaceae bacterium]